MQQQPEDVEEDLGMLWPSQNKNAGAGTRERDNNRDSDVMAGMWPSQQANRGKQQQKLVGGVGSHYPNNPKSSIEILKNKLSEPVAAFGDNSDMLDDLEDDSNATVGIVWPIANDQVKDTKASGDLNSSEKQQRKRWLQDADRDDEELNEMPPKSSAL